MKALLVLLRTSLLIFLGFVLISILYFFLYSKPSHYHGKIKPLDFSLSYEDVSVKSYDGKRLKAWFIPSKKSLSAIIMLHGWPADKSDILPYTHFLSKNFSLLYTDIRGMGESEGMICGGKDEIKDIKRWIDYLRSRNIKRIGIFGYSYGGFIATRAINEIEELDFAIVDSPFNSISWVIKKLVLYKNPAEKILLPLISLNYKIFCGESDKGFSVDNALKRIKKKTLIICGDKDDICFNESIKYNLKINPYVKIQIMEGFSHGETPFSKNYKNIINSFLNNSI
ncbi:MAG: alpha/beta hydrolase [Elusimicrobiales bacterium]